MQQTTVTGIFTVRPMIFNYLQRGSLLLLLERDEKPPKTSHVVLGFLTTTLPKQTFLLNFIFCLFLLWFSSNPGN